MMGRTDAVFRGLIRRLSRHTLVTTEMLSPSAIAHGDLDRTLPVAVDGPVAVQLGGSDPTALARAARVAVDRGYDEVDLNCGCPSDRAADGTFGACLMLDPARVARCVAALRTAVDVPVTVKCRIGVDGRDGFADLLEFVDTVAEAGAARVTVHARTAVLGGLSPRANRTVPPLRHDEVHRLAAERPELTICLNGGVRTLAEAVGHLGERPGAAGIGGVMIGRGATDDPYLFAAADRDVFGDASWRAPGRVEVAAALAEDLARRGSDGLLDPYGVPHLLNLFHGVRGARRWRRTLSELRAGPGVRPSDVEAALTLLADEALAA